jgi:hypothetical protein
MTQTIRISLSPLVWGCSLVLQSALFISLFSRRISNRFPFFTSLIGFYLVRSALLYLIFGFISVSAYGGLYKDLLLLDILVQACAVFEITSALIQELDGRTLAVPSVRWPFFASPPSERLSSWEFFPAHAYPSTAVSSSLLFF